MYYWIILNSNPSNDEDYSRGLKDRRHNVLLLKKTIGREFEKSEFLFRGLIKTIEKQVTGILSRPDFGLNAGPFPIQK